MNKLESALILALIDGEFTFGNSLTYYQLVTKKLLDNLDVTKSIMNKTGIKRVIKRFSSLNKLFKCKLETIKTKFKSLLTKQYFENKVMIKKLIRVLKRLK